MTKTNEVKQNNRDKILWAYYYSPSGQATVKEIAEHTSLSVATVNTITNELVISGELSVHKTISSTGGRPSTVYRFNVNRASLLVISMYYIEEEFILRGHVTDLLGREIANYAYEPCTDIDVEKLTQWLQEMKEKHADISLIRLAIPGVVKDGYVGFNDVSSLQNLHLESYLTDALQLPIFLDNDMNILAQGLAKAENKLNLIAIYVPEIRKAGAGVIANGQIIQGASGFAGELHYLPKHSSIIEEWTLNVINILTSVLNPEKIYFYGVLFTDAVQNKVQQLINDFDQKDMLPNLHFQADINEDLLHGLIGLAISDYRKVIY